MIHQDHPNDYTGSKHLCCLTFEDTSFTHPKTIVVMGVIDSVSTNVLKRITIVDFDRMGDETAYHLIKQYTGNMPISCHAATIGMSVDGYLRIISMAQVKSIIGPIYEFSTLTISSKRRRVKRSSITGERGDVKYVW